MGAMRPVLPRDEVFLPDFARLRRDRPVYGDVQCPTCESGPGGSCSGMLRGVEVWSHELCHIDRAMLWHEVSYASKNQVVASTPLWELYGDPNVRLMALTEEKKSLGEIH